MDNCSPATYAPVPHKNSVKLSVPSISKEVLELGYETFLVKDATRGITSEGIEHALKEMTEAGIQIITSEDLMATGNTSKEEL